MFARPLIGVATLVRVSLFLFAGTFLLVTSRPHHSACHHHADVKPAKAGLVPSLVQFQLPPSNSNTPNSGTPNTHHHSEMPALHHHQNNLGPCLAEQRAAGRHLHLSVDTDLTVEPDGSVSRVIVTNAESAPGLAHCLEAKLLEWTFPSSAIGRTVTLPINIRTP